MKTKIILTSLFVLSAITLICVQLKPEYIETDNEIQQFLKCSTFSEFKHNFDIQIKDLDLKNISTVSYTEANGKVFYVPVLKKGRQLGLLAIFSKNNGEILNMLYSDYTEIEAKGLVRVTTSNYLVAEFKAEKLQGTYYNLSLLNVALRPIRIKKDKIFLNNIFSIPFAEAKAEGGWWSCTTQCYADAKSACQGNATCDFLCDIANITGQCTISMAAACAMYCL